MKVPILDAEIENFQNVLGRLIRERDGKDAALGSVRAEDLMKRAAEGLDEVAEPSRLVEHLGAGALLFVRFVRRPSIEFTKEELVRLASDDLILDLGCNFGGLSVSRMHLAVHSGCGLKNIA